MIMLCMNVILDNTYFVWELFSPSALILFTRLLHVSGWEMDQTKKSMHTSNTFFVFFYYSDVSPSVSDQFGFNGEMSWLTADTDSWLVEHGRCVISS